MSISREQPNSEVRRSVTAAARPGDHAKSILELLLAVFAVAGVLLSTLPLLHSSALVIATVVYAAIALVSIYVWRHFLSGVTLPLRISVVAAMFWMGSLVLSVLSGYYLVDSIVWNTFFAAIVTLLLGILFAPVMVAWTRDSEHRVAILILVVLAGWTIIGWVVAFVWAAIDPVATTGDQGSNTSKSSTNVAPPNSTQDSDALASLDQLAQLAERGAITQEDFQTKKKELLARI